MRLLKILGRLGVFALLAAALFGSVGLGYLYLAYGRDLPDISMLETYRPSETTRILASDGTVIATLYQENRIWAPLENVGPWVVPALLATEDSRFFEHRGFDPIGLVRVVVNTALTREVREGASTITMQLARNVFPLSDVDWKRKVKEIFLSVQLEKRYGKQKILELYLNQVYFGGGAHGIHSASRLYFNKGPKDLTLSESALLAGLIQAPSRFSPLEHPERAFHRQDEVLERMLAVGAINESQRQEAIVERETMTFDGVDQRSFEVDKFPYFSSYVVSEVSARFSEDALYRGGLTIVTTLDPALQRFAQEVLAEEVYAAGWELNVDSGALVLVENETGFLKAVVGGLGWSDTNQFNRAFQTRRQPGSSFKPVIYAAALEAGYSSESTISDSPVTYQDGSPGGWSPKNSDEKFQGAMTLRKALQGSRNVPAVRLLDALGVDRVIDLGYRMGIRAPIPGNLSIALGAVDASPLEMTELFSVFPNDGNRVAPTAIKMIQDASGQVLEDHRKPSNRAVISQQTARGMVSMLLDAVDHGTGTRARVAGWQIAGKTGTTDSFRDAWFCGFSPHFTCAVWIGNDDNSPMIRSFGGDLPATIFQRVMEFALADRAPKSFPDYSPSGEKKAVGDQGPKPEESPTPESTPEVEETPDIVELVEEPGDNEFVPPDGQSYLLPETLGGNVPGESEPSFADPLTETESPAVRFTPAPLPEETFSSPGGISPPEHQEIDHGTPPPPSQVELPSFQGE